MYCQVRGRCTMIDWQRDGILSEHMERPYKKEIDGTVTAGTVVDRAP